jgi:hypothetical protein
VGSRGATGSAAAENNANGPRIHPGERPPTLSVTQRNGGCPELTTAGFTPARSRQFRDVMLAAFRYSLIDSIHASWTFFLLYRPKRRQPKEH